jgi:predicted TIM-barrel fold metal-dependent hydrolase
MAKLTDGIAEFLFERNEDHTWRSRRVVEVESGRVTLPFVSVDDHLCEPPEVFVGRLPARFAELTPRVVRGEDHCDYWLFEGQRVAIGGGNVAAGWVTEDWYNGPIALDDARPGTYDIHARVADMDLNGVLASLCFPSMVFGFAGQLFGKLKDRDFGLAALRAYNDWIAEAWAGPYPDRIIPCQVTWLLDPEVAAGEVRRNAARGFKAVAFTEKPDKLGLAPIADAVWDPFLAACAETETVINLHTGSSSEILPGGLAINGFVAALEWLQTAQVPLRFPDIKIVMSEGGIGWVPMLIDQLVYRRRHEKLPDSFVHWPPGAPPPEEVLRRNFWFTSFYDPSTLAARQHIGVDRIMFESDYPHPDSSWPDSQDFLAAQMQGFPPDDIDRLTWRNAAQVYRHPVTPEILTGAQAEAVATGEAKYG